jgi:hypothetical protein
MSNTVVKQILSEGASKLVLYVYLESDGSEGEFTNYVLLDPAVDLTPPLLSTQLTVLQVWYNFSWFDATLSFDDLTPYPNWTFTRDADGYKDFRYFGGLKDRAGIDHTSKLLLSTRDFAPLGSKGNIVIELKKN